MASRRLVFFKRSTCLPIFVCINYILQFKSKKKGTKCQQKLIRTFSCWKYISTVLQFLQKCLIQSEYHELCVEMVAKIANSLQNLLTQRETRRNRFPQVKYWLYERVQGVKNIFLRSETRLLHKNCYQGKSVKNSALYLTCVSLKMTDTHKSCNYISDNTISDRFVVMFS